MINNTTTCKLFIDPKEYEHERGRQGYTFWGNICPCCGGYTITTIKESTGGFVEVLKCIEPKHTGCIG